MLKTKYKVSKLPKIGPKYEKLLNKLEIKTINDLLYHFPFRYEDYSKITSVADIKANKILEGSNVTVKATIEKITNIYTKNRKRLTIAKVSDSSDVLKAEYQENLYSEPSMSQNKTQKKDNKTQTLEIVWFNQHYLTKTLKKNRTYYFSGKVQKFSSKLNLVAPTYEPATVNEQEATQKEQGSGASKIETTNLNTARLVPIYSETKGLTSRWLRTRINDVLSIFENTNEFKEFIPEKTLKKHKLPYFENAINNIHFPPNLKESERARKRFAFEELLLELLSVEDIKQTWNKKYAGVHIEKNRYKNAIEDFKNSLPFTLTNSQKKSVNQIFDDLDSKQPMNRLLEGDVGSGKTIVAILAAYLTHLNGFKTLYMAPTEILAKQHHKTFKSFLKDVKIDIELITGSTRKNLKKKSGASKNSNSKSNSIEGNNKNNVIIGTHALLFEKEDFKNVGLIIIDEQHRFGVEQRAKLAKMGTKNMVPNMLTMTATPIPRTLALTVYGDLNISVLDEMPNKNKKITTKVVGEKMREKTYKLLAQRAKGGEQAFIVCPFIEESVIEGLEHIKAAQKEYEILTKGVFKGLAVGLLHGKMTPQEKQNVMQDFRNERLQILISTPVIEVGVDVPNATIMIIESAERFGLASLHQLRGRVGRGEKEGFCFVFMSSYSKKAYARLKNLENIANGLKLAEIDMQYRGQGDIFGTMQHGFKRFKLADLSDINFVESVKKEAQSLYKNIDNNNLKALKNKVNSKSYYISNN